MEIFKKLEKIHPPLGVPSMRGVPSMTEPFIEKEENDVRPKGRVELGKFWLTGECLD